MSNNYQELMPEFTKIDETDYMQFVDGIDDESISYRYCNSLNWFRCDQESKINL
jgi:hypothetical protein